MHLTDPQDVGRLELGRAGDWAALGAEVRRRAAVLAALHIDSVETGPAEGNGPRIIRLDTEVRP